jgi:hypothetical protein
VSIWALCPDGRARVELGGPVAGELPGLTLTESGAPDIGRFMDAAKRPITFDRSEA